MFAVDCAVLSAIDEDSLCVPRLLTDYILKGQLILYSLWSCRNKKPQLWLRNPCDFMLLLSKGLERDKIIITITITIILLINATNVRNKSRTTQKWKDTKYKIKKIQ